MSNGKPGLFGRLKNAISSTLNDAVDSVSDPGAELGLMLDDLERQIKDAERDLKQAMVDRKVMERKIEDTEKDEKSWASRAEQALKLGDEGLARAALEKKKDLSQEVRDTKAALSQQIGLVEDMKDHIKESKRKLKSLNLRRGSLMQQARQAKESESTGGMGMPASNKIDEIENKIAELEAYNEVMAETADGRQKEVEIEAKLRALDDGGSSEVDDELAALKAKLKDKGALPPAEEE